MGPLGYVLAVGLGAFGAVALDHYQGDKAITVRTTRIEPGAWASALAILIGLGIGSPAVFGLGLGGGAFSLGKHANANWLPALAAASAASAQPAALPAGAKPGAVAGLDYTYSDVDNEDLFAALNEALEVASAEGAGG